MTSPISAGRDATWRHVVGSAALVLGIALPAAVLMALAFGTARGVAVKVGPDSYDTSQLVLNFDWWWAAYLLAIPVFVAARRDPRLAVAAALVAAVPQWATAHIYVVRFSESGWGDGLESFAYLYAVLMTLLFAGAATWGALSGRRRRMPHWPAGFAL